MANTARHSAHQKMKGAARQHYGDGDGSCRCGRTFKNKKILQVLKYSICCPVPGGEGGSPALGYPHPNLADWYPHHWKGVPKMGYPHQVMGYPLSRDGVLPSKAGWRYQPSPSQGWMGVPPPQWTDRWMDRHVSKHNLPSYYVRGR